MNDKNDDYYKGFNDAIDYILKWLEKDYSIEKTISISKLKMKLLSQLRKEQYCHNMKVPQLLTLDDAVKIAVNHFDADPILARQEFEQKTYCPAEDVYGAGYYEGFQHAIDILKKEVGI